MNGLNLIVQNFFISTRTPGVSEFFFTITSIFNASFSFAIIILLFGYLAYLVRGKKYAILFFCSITTTTALVYLLKYFFNTARPEDSFFIANGASLPSGHATISVVFFILLNYIFSRSLSNYYRRIFVFLSFLIVFLVSVSRLYLGVHWLSDVLFGVLLGMIISYFSIRFFKAYEYNL